MEKPQETQHIKILYADDDPDDQVLFQEALMETDWQTDLITFDDCDQLLAYLGNSKNGQPDMIFLDINMPRKNGKLCLKEIRQKLEYNQVPVIMFSTSTHEADIAETFAYGANLYVPKGRVLRDEVMLLQTLLNPAHRHTLLHPQKEKFLYTSDA